MTLRAAEESDWRRLSPPPGASSGNGSVNVDRSPGVERTPICAPCATTIRRVRARPMPCPAISLSWAVRVR